MMYAYTSAMNTLELLGIQRGQGFQYHLGFLESPETETPNFSEQKAAQGQLQATGTPKLGTINKAGQR